MVILKIGKSIADFTSSMELLSHYRKMQQREAASLEEVSLSFTAPNALKNSSRVYLEDS